MADILELPPGTRREWSIVLKCSGCKARIRFYESDAWVEYGYAYARCPHCNSENLLPSPPKRLLDREGASK